MKIIIDIPDRIYKRKGYLNVIDSEILRNALKDGKPLPKGHGRLIDADALEKRMVERETELNDDRALWESSAVEVALDMFAPTILEADKEEEGD